MDRIPGMDRIMEAVFAVSLMVGGLWPAAAPSSLLGGPSAQVFDVAPFQSAHFGLVGAVKWEGITVDILGEGDLLVPDRQRSSFKVGPVTGEIVLVGDALYTRSRFDRQWNRQIIPEPANIDPLGQTDLFPLIRDARLVGREVVDGVATQHYTSRLDVRPLLEPLLRNADRETRRVIDTLEISLDLWIGAQDRIVRQERLIATVTLPAIEPEGEEAPLTFDYTLGLTNVNEPVQIEAPQRNDPRPVRTPRPQVVPLAGPPGTPIGAGSGRGPVSAPAQVPGR